jgi:hypothetical protein
MSKKKIQVHFSSLAHKSLIPFFTEISTLATIKSNSKVSRAPCCHKCWNKCPPYLARRYLADSTVFQDKDVRRYVKEEVWSFLSEDVQVQRSVNAY